VRVLRDRPREQWDGRASRSDPARRVEHWDEANAVLTSGKATTERMLFTIGYEKALQKGVLAVLAAARIEVLLDIRDRPISRRPGFSKRQLAAAVQEAGMGYVHLAALGTPPEGRLAGRRREWDRFWAIVDDKIARPEAEVDLRRAGDIAAAAPSCLLCYEADWQSCHRRRVGEILARRHGFTLCHLRPVPA
jgi:uncharacterized protein (DUF488 family)